MQGFVNYASRITVNADICKDINACEERLTTRGKASPVEKQTIPRLLQELILAKAHRHVPYPAQMRRLITKLCRARLENDHYLPAGARATEVFS